MKCFLPHTKGLCPILILIGWTGMSHAASIDLQQARNGPQSAPEPEALWVKGNLGTANSHYVESHSIPYRAVITDLTPGSHLLVIEWDTKSKGYHAIDFLSSYQRLLPHDVFASHSTPETILPLAELTGTFSEPITFPIPQPGDLGTPVQGQPMLGFSVLPVEERSLTAWNATITNAYYVMEESLQLDQASSRLAIEFVTTNSTVVMAWGGHIAAQYDWGLRQGATEISGSPYHMRLVALDDSVGNQDRSLEADDTPVPPPCNIVGVSQTCSGSLLTYRLAYPSTAPETTYAWSLAGDTAGATLVGPTNGASVDVQLDGGGVVTLQVQITLGTVQSLCDFVIDVIPPTTATPLENQLACWGSNVRFATETSGLGPLDVSWTFNGEPLVGATNAWLDLEAVTIEDAGLYCVTVSGPCGVVFQCGLLDVTDLPVATCPEPFTVECLEEVPPPDASGVSVQGGYGEITISHQGDVIATNGCEYAVTRSWRVADACGNASVCDQTILVVDTTLPVLTCPPDVVLEFPADTTPEQTGFATATDACHGALDIRFTDVVTQDCGDAMNIARTWTAVDACGNTTQCVQLIRVVDTTSPEIFCPADILVESGSHAGTLVTFEIETSDASTSPIEVVVVPPSGTVFPLGVTEVVATATDACGNSRQCTFLVTVVDTTPPVLGPCPADMIVSEAPPGSGGAVVSFVLPSATDIGDEAPVVDSDPASGSVLPAGYNTIVCTATDASGNRTSCSFTVQVVPETIVATSTGDSGPGSLRQALTDANAAPGINIIAFNIPGEGPFVIELETPLPVVTEPATIDGSTQPGYFFRPLIDVDGGAMDLAVGLHITGGDTLVRGVVLSGFDVGLRLDGRGGNVIQGNYIGLDPEDILPAGNLSHGMVVTTAGNILGGAQPGDGNVIGGNQGAGLVLEGPDASGNVVQGNRIGIDPDGAEIGNGEEGILLRGGAANNLLGGPDPGQGNRISFNGGAGVALASDAGQGNPILGNAIASNGGLGIDLGRDGVTSNDLLDPDEGPNRLQNHPELISVQILPEGTRLQGRLDSLAGRKFALEFFSSAEADPSGLGEGAVSFGSLAIQTDDTGRGRFDLTLPMLVSLGEVVTATATDEAGNTSEFSAGSPVLQAPVILEHPTDTSAAPGEPASFCVVAVGSPPLQYQWRQNGVNIPGATNACYSIPSTQILDGGEYAVLVGNTVGSVISVPATLLLILPELQAADDFADRTLLVGVTDVLSGNNFRATREPGEPLHFNQPGHRSVWYTWQAPAGGIAEIRTSGSTFDTVLAIYTGDALTNLTMVAGDEDRGGFFTSGVRFNVEKDTFYHIAVDGLGEAAGQYVFELSFEATTSRLPDILEQPESLTVTLGSTAVFMVAAEEGCREGHQNCKHDKDSPPGIPDGDIVRYQWLFNGEPIPTETIPILTLTNVQPEMAGVYSVLVNVNDLTVESFPVLLQINTGLVFQPALAQDKFVYALGARPIQLGIPLSPVPPGGGGENGGSAGSVVRGFTGSQVFNTRGSTTESGEGPICNVIGGASQYLLFESGEDGMLNIRTDGSTFNTVLSVSVIDATSTNFLTELGCNDDATNSMGQGVMWSEVTVPVTAGTTNIIRIDGYQAATGILNLTYSLVTSSTLAPMGVTQSGAYQLLLMGRPEAMRFEIQYTENFKDWVPLLQAEDPDGHFEYTDDSSPGQATRYYRAVMLP